MDIKILGTGCVNCKNLETLTRRLLDELGLPADIEKVTDLAEIASWGVMPTPELFIDGDVVLTGRITEPDQLDKLISNHRDQRGATRISRR